MIRVRKILYPTDFSSYSNQAYFHALSLAEKHNASLTILFVFTPESSSTSAKGGSETKGYWQDQLEQIRPVDPGIKVDHVLLEGNPATEIVNYASHGKYDLVVMGTHGRTGLEKVVLGSVAEKVLSDASCSVLVVKLPGNRTSK